MLTVIYSLSFTAAAWSLLTLGQAAPMQHDASSIFPALLVNNGPVGVLALAMFFAIRWLVKRDEEKEKRIEALHAEYKAKLDAMNIREIESFAKLAEASQRANAELAKVGAELSAARAEVEAWKARAERSENRLAELELEVKRLHEEARR